MEQKQIEIEGQTYRIRRLNAFKQFHVVRRLAPAFFAMGDVAAKAGGDLKDDFSALAAMGPVADAIKNMSDTDAEYVLNTCLLVCDRQIDGGNWAPVKVQGAQQLQFDDIKLPVMMQLVFAVLRENVGNFFQGPAAQS